MTPHILLIAQSGSLLCQHCCQMDPPPRDMPVEHWIDYCKGFVLSHKHCEKPAEVSKQVQMFDELAGKEKWREIPVICSRCNKQLAPGEDPLAHLDQCRTQRESAKERPPVYVDPATLGIEPGTDYACHAIDGSTDDPAPEIDPPGHDEPELTDQDDAFGRMYPRAHDHLRLCHDLQVVLQGKGIAPTREQLEAFPFGSAAYDEIAHWCRMQLATINRTNHPEFECYLPTTPQPMPKALAKLMKPAAKKRGARPLTSGKRKEASA